MEQARDKDCKKCMKAKEKWPHNKNLSSMQEHRVRHSDKAGTFQRQTSVKSIYILTLNVKGSKLQKFTQ